MDTGINRSADDVREDSESAASNQLGLFFDQTRCTGCYACLVACKDWHDIPPGPARWMRMATIEKGKYPNPFLAFQVKLCHHCENAACTEACPSKAISKRESDGIVVVDREKCAGREKCGFPCSQECPAGTDVLGFISLMKEGKYAQAWKLIAETNPFPGVCGRVCFHPCELACNRNQVDEPVAIHALERLAAEHAPDVPPFTIERKKQRVAIVGSGPAGLSCAYQLALLGYMVTVYEALPEAGGMLRVGIPEYRLPESVLDREIAFIESLGVEIKTSMRLGENLCFEELDGFDAVFLAVGAHKEKTLNIPGIGLKQVIPGVDFLRNVRLNHHQDIGKKIVVLGGGNVAFDCARTAQRLGATEVHVVCPESQENMPAEPAEIRQGKEEVIAIHTSQIASKIAGQSKHVSGVEFMNLRSMKFDENGILHFDVIEKSEHVIPADTVILAIGQEPDIAFLPRDIDIKRGIILTRDGGATSRPRYFAGGDAASSQRRVAYAIGSGRKAATAIDRFLKGLPAEKPAEKRAIESRLIDKGFIPKKARNEGKELTVSRRRGNFTEIDLGLDDKQARTEASRCLTCRGMCFVSCPYGAPQFGIEDNPRMQKCDFCLEEWTKGKKPICVRSCTMRALDAGPLKEILSKYGDVKQAEGFSYSEKTRPSVTFKPKAYRRKQKTT